MTLVKKKVLADGTVHNFMKLGTQIPCDVFRSILQAHTFPIRLLFQFQVCASYTLVFRNLCIFCYLK